jgi:hypothetical protein
VLEIELNILEIIVGVVQLKQELKNAITELESAIRTVRKLREVDIRDAIEVMSSTKSVQKKKKKCCENDLSFSEKYQFQEQRTGK